MLAVLALVACTRGSAPSHPSPESPERHTTLAPPLEDEPSPPYDRAAIANALTVERAAEARDERVLTDAEASGDGDRLRVARANLAVRRRFIATLELCEAHGRLCPPVLDDAPLRPALASYAEPDNASGLRFDLESWRAIAVEVQGRACACRSVSCIETLDDLIDQLEVRPMPDVRADETASESLTRARECLFRLRGKRALPRTAIADH